MTPAPGLLLLLAAVLSTGATYSRHQITTNEISAGPVGGECEDCRNFCGDCKYCRFCDIFGCSVNSNCKSCYICANCVAGASCQQHCGTQPVSWHGQGKQCRQRGLLEVLLL